MPAIDFKSVGELRSAQKFQPTENTVPIGIKTPLRLGNQSDGLFAMHFNIADQIQDNFRNLLLTNHGERLGKYDFGANLKELTMEHGQNEFDNEAIVRIKTAINKYMPFIEPKTFQSERVVNNNTLIERVDIKIIYDVVRLGILGKEIMISLFVRG